ncbi:hypothetical protein AB4874_10185 [Thioclava sp. 15-R06ZXC-3]|uniref:Uncharacterized protein n=1 Tax=Thioclava arctica TaxID=3238301 RepID=A0ABV3TKD9_9RHOB
MHFRRLAYLALTIALGLPAGYLLHESYHHSRRDPAREIFSMFEERCLPKLYGAPEDHQGLIEAPMSLHYTDFIDPLSRFSLAENSNDYSVEDLFSPIDAKQARELAALARARIPELIGLAESHDIDPIGDMAIGWMQGEPGSPERWGVTLFRFGPGMLSLSLHLPAELRPQSSL